MEVQKANYADEYIELLRDQYEKIDNEVWYEIIDKHVEYSQETKDSVAKAEQNIAINKQKLIPLANEVDGLQADLDIIDR